MFRKVFKALVELFGLCDVRLEVYSLRPGGATRDFLRRGRMELTLLIGRWQSTKAARVHLESAAAESVELRLTPAQQQELRFAAKLVEG